MPFCTKSNTAVKFFIGSSPSLASSIINPENPADGVMISFNTLQKRRSDFVVGDWILDSGAFTEVARYGGYRQEIEAYYQQICRWTKCGNMLIAIAQDWMCEPFVLRRTGLSIARHQELTIERYKQLLRLNPPTAIMPVLQGYRSSDYLAHLQQYANHLPPNQWVGVGSVCRRNGNPDEVANILRGIKLIRPDLRLHGFGLKLTALENLEIRELLYSADSMAYSYPKYFGDKSSELQLAHKYQEKISAAATDSVHKRRAPMTAGAGNGQGRRSNWKSGKTKAIRVPEKFAPKLLELARKWDKSGNH